MKQEYLTSRGKLIVERDVLYIRNLKSSIGDTILGLTFYPLIALILSVLRFVSAEDNMDYFVGLIWGIIFLANGYSIYDVLFRRSFSKRIPVQRIKSFELKPDQFGLETELIMHLKNGRYRSVFFRTMENQYKPLAEYLSAHQLEPQFA